MQFVGRRWACTPKKTQRKPECAQFAPLQRIRRAVLAPLAPASCFGSASIARPAASVQGLAKSIAWDGEGATVLIECEVLGAGSDADANRVAKSVVGSSLAKSAIFGHDPNWGRIAAAAGWVVVAGAARRGGRGRGGGAGAVG